MRLIGACLLSLEAAACSDDGASMAHARDAAMPDASVPAAPAPSDAGTCSLVTCTDDAGETTVGGVCANGHLSCPWRGTERGRDECPGSYLGCDTAVEAVQRAGCRFETAIVPDVVRVGEQADGGNPCLAPVDDCELSSGWQFEISGDGTRDRMHFQLCGAACTAAIMHPEARVEAIALCIE
jgi:hypothetical protein